LFFIASISGCATVSEGVHEAASAPPPQPPGRDYQADAINAAPVIVAPPANIRRGRRESDSQMIVFRETRRVVLKSPLTVDLTTSTLGSSGTIPAGVKVNSYYLHFDSVQSHTERGVGTIVFPHKILGIITKDQSLVKSDAVLGRHRTEYPADTVFRGIEMGRGNEKWQEYAGEYWNFQDLVAIDGDALTVDFQVFYSTDDVRIVTAAR